jgi:hypothetical protein
MWCHMNLVRTDILVERITSIFSVERIRELGTLSVTGRLNHVVKKH